MTSIEGSVAVMAYGSVPSKAPSKNSVINCRIPILEISKSIYPAAQSSFGGVTNSFCGHPSVPSSMRLSTKNALMSSLGRSNSSPKRPNQGRKDRKRPDDQHLGTWPTQHLAWRILGPNRLAFHNGAARPFHDQCRYISRNRTGSPIGMAALKRVSTSTSAAVDPPPAECPITPSASISMVS